MQPSAYTPAVRRNLKPSELGDLLDRPLNAVLGLHRQDRSILLTPVWHLFRQGSFYFQVPGGDRKIAMLKRDPRCSILVAEHQHPYRAIESTGEGRMSTEDYEELGPEIVRRYIEAHDPGAVLGIVRTYYDEMMAGDEAKLARAFHPRACIVGNEQGELYWATLDEFVADCKKAVAEAGPHEWRIDGVSFEGDTAPSSMRTFSRFSGRWTVPIRSSRIGTFPGSVWTQGSKAKGSVAN